MGYRDRVSDLVFYAQPVRLVQFKTVSMRSEKPICAPPRLSEVSGLKSPLKRFQYGYIRAKETETVIFVLRFRLRCSKQAV